MQIFTCLKEQNNSTHLNVKDYTFIWKLVYLRYLSVNINRFKCSFEFIRLSVKHHKVKVYMLHVPFHEP